MRLAVDFVLVFDFIVVFTPPKKKFRDRLFAAAYGNLPFSIYNYFHIGAKLPILTDGVKPVGQNCIGIVRQVLERITSDVQIDTTYLAGDEIRSSSISALILCASSPFLSGSADSLLRSISSRSSIAVRSCVGDVLYLVIMAFFPQSTQSPHLVALPPGLYQGLQKHCIHHDTISGLLNQ